jgi:tight adherence protein B
MSSAMSAGAIAGGLLMAAALLARPVRASPARRLGAGGRHSHGQGPQPGTGLGPSGDALLLDVVRAVATQVRAGAHPAAAWAVARQVHAPPGAITEPPGAQPSTSGTPAARAVGAAWRLADRTGAPLAQTLDSVVDGLRRRADAAAALDAELAGPRATARLLAVLPLVGLGLGQLIGAHPLQVLVTTGLGRSCAAGGLLLLGAGQLWMRACIRQVEALA